MSAAMLVDKDLTCVGWCVEGRVTRDGRGKKNT